MVKIKFFKSLLLIISTAISLCYVTSWAANNSQPAPAKTTKAKGPLTSAEIAFIKLASGSSLLQISLSELAARKTSADNIRSFAKQIITDQTRLNNNLQKIAKGYGVPMVTQLDFYQSRMVERLEQFTGAKFDKEYTTAQQSVLSNTVDRYRAQMKTVNDQYLKQYTSDALLVLQGHKRQIDDISSGRSLK